MLLGLTTRKVSILWILVHIAAKISSKIRLQINTKSPEVDTLPGFFKRLRLGSEIYYIRSQAKPFLHFFLSFFPINQHTEYPYEIHRYPTKKPQNL